MKHFFLKTISICAIALIATLTDSAAQYCTPTYTNGTQFGIFIMKVQLDSIQDSTGAMGNPWYSYSSGLSTTLQPLKTYTINVAGGTFNGGSVGIFIDYNGDQDYSDAGEKVGQIIPIGAGPSTSSVTFTVPCSAQPGTTRMRVRLAAANGGVSNVDPCQNYGWGECQDYKIHIKSNPLYIVNTVAFQQNVLNVVKGTASQEIMQIQVKTDGCQDTLGVQDFYIRSSGTSDTADISNVQLFYTGTSNVFSTTTLYGTTSLLDNFQISGSQQLIQGTNYFWLTYDINSSATDGNLVDAEFDSIHVDGKGHNSLNVAPNGYRIIDSAMTFQSFLVTQPDSTPVAKGSVANMIMAVEIVMSNNGGSVPATKFTFNTTGSTLASTDLTNARLYYTGTSNYFDTTILFGSYSNPNGNFDINGIAYLNPGSNYFWLAYDIASGAASDDTVDAELNSVEIFGTSHANSSVPSAFRTIVPSYCFPVHPGCGTTFIQGFMFAGISNPSSGCTNISGNSYTDYGASFYTSNLNIGNSYNASIYASNANMSGSMWIDYNHNGSYEASEYNSFGNINANDTSTINVTIPCGAKTGWTKLRVRTRGAGGANGSTDACTQFGSGETEEYLVYIGNHPVSYVGAITASTADILPGWTSQQIIKVALVANNCGGSLSLSKLDFNTNGTTDTNDIKAAKIYFTGAGKTFNTNTLLGSINKPGIDINISCSQTLVADTNWIWLVYDIDTNATVGNYVDAEFISATVSLTQYNANVSAPSGNRMINNYMTVNNIVVAHPNVTPVYSGSTNQVITRMLVNMSSGATVNLTTLYLNTQGTTSPNVNISNARVWSTGGDNTFTSPIQHGSVIASPNGKFTVTGITSLQPGDNYFWLTYDIQANSIANDTVDATLDSLVINGGTQSVSNGNPNGYRLIAKTYCVPTHQQTCGQSPTYIHGVSLNTLYNWNSGCTNNNARKYNIYTANQYTTTLNRGSVYKLIIKNDTNSQAQAFGFWIDFNQNGTFDGTEFYLINANLAINKTDTLSFQVPCSAKKGLTQLRIRSRSSNGTIASTDACSVFGSGETEDYTITIDDNKNTGFLGADKISCNGSSITLSPGNSYVSYSWSTGDSTSSITVNTPGKYYVTATTISGCQGTDTVNIIASSVTLNLGNDSTICNGGVVSFDAGTGYSNYMWSTGDTTQSTSASIAGDYICTVKNSDGCSVSDTVALILSYASLNLGVDTSICAGANITLDAGLHTSYLWSTGDTTQTITVNQAGSYRVFVTEAGGCNGYDTIDVQISIPQINLGNDISVCEKTPVTLDAGIWSAYNWNTGANSQTISPDTSGIFILTIADSYGCIDADTIEVTFNPYPSLSLGNDTIICIGSSITLDGSSASTWIWSTGETTQKIVVNVGGTYSVTSTSSFGCAISDTIKITPSSANVSVGQDKQFCEGTSDTLFATSGYTSYQWSNGATSWFIIPTVSGSYWCKVTNPLGCSATDTANVTILKKPVSGFTTQYISGTWQFIPNDTTAGARYYWDFGDSSLSTKRAPKYNYTTPGNYMVKLIITSPNGCETETNQSINFTGVGSVSSLKTGSLHLYPNPSNGILNMSFDVLTIGNVNLRLIDITGKTVYVKNLGRMIPGNQYISLDLSHLTGGMYYLETEINGEIVISRINIIQH